MHRTTLTRTKRRTRWASRATTLHGRTTLKNRLPGHGTTRRGTHCAADRNSRLHRWWSWSHGRFVHRPRPSLRNDHARRGRRSNWLCHNRRRWRSARRSHRNCWRRRSWCYGRCRRTHRRRSHRQRRDRRVWNWRRNERSRSNGWSRRSCCHGNCRRHRWLCYWRCNRCRMTHRGRRCSRRFFHRRLRDWRMRHGRRHSTRCNGWRNRFLLLRNRLQHISGTRDVRQINLGFYFFFAPKCAGTGLASRGRAFRCGTDVHTYLLRLMLLQRTGMRLLLGHPNQR